MVAPVWMPPGAALVPESGTKVPPPLPQRMLAKRELFRIWPPGRNAIHRGQVRIGTDKPLTTGGLTATMCPGRVTRHAVPSAPLTAVQLRGCQPDARETKVPVPRDRRPALGRCGCDLSGRPGQPD